MRYSFLIVAAAILVCYPSYSKNWDRDAAQTEAGRIRSEYLSKAGTLPSYRYSEETGKSEPTGEVYHGNCCGEADAYEASDFLVDEMGRTWAILTCNDPDNCKEIEGKVTRPPGSKWLVPPDKVLLNFSPVNRTGQGWVYISPNATGPDGQATVLCWSAPPGG